MLLYIMNSFINPYKLLGVDINTSIEKFKKKIL